MGLLALSIVPATPQDFGVFSFSNMDEHIKAGLAVARKFGVNPPVHPLDPFFPLDPDHLRLHQDMHNNINSILGTPSTDLMSVDFRNREERESWILLHFSEHQLWARALATT